MIKIIVVLLYFAGPNVEHSFTYTSTILATRLCAQKKTLGVIHAYAMICGYAIVMWLNDAVRTSWKCVCEINGEVFVCLEVLIVR